MRTTLDRRALTLARFLIVTLVLALSALSCVSVKMPFGPVPKATQAHVQKPAGAFVTMASNVADEAWISQKTGNTLSYLSECKETDESPKQIALDTAQAIENSKVLDISSGTIDSYPSAEVLVSGRVDSQKVKMAIAVFKTSQCTFSITYGGLENQFDAEWSEFVTFKKGFKAP